MSALHDPCPMCGERERERGRRTCRDVECIARAAVTPNMPAPRVVVEFNGEDLLSRLDELARLRVQLDAAIVALAPLCTCKPLNPGRPVVHGYECPITRVLQAGRR